MAASDAAAPHEAVHLDRAGAVAVTTLDNPPVNALSKEVRAGIAAHLETARAWRPARFPDAPTGFRRV
jgi:enoyl-CoA hydratase/carnithine racemase